MKQTRVEYQFNTNGLCRLATWVALSASAAACSLNAPSVADYAQSRSRVDAGAGQGGAAAAGSAGAAGVGAAGDDDHAGAAGADQGPCISQPESCNGNDDDCDGVVDNGCPTGFLRASTKQRTSLGDSTGGSTWADLCKNDAVVAGFQLALGGSVDQIGVICRTYALGVSMKVVPYRYQVLLGDPEPLATHPTATNSAVSQLNCPEGLMVVGLDTLEQYGNAAHTGNTTFVSFAVLCAEPIIDMTGTTPSFAWQNVVEVGPVYTAYYDSSQAITKTDSLATSEVLVGLHGASGNWVDSVGLTSSSIQVLLR